MILYPKYLRGLMNWIDMINKSISSAYVSQVVTLKCILVGLFKVINVIILSQQIAFFEQMSQIHYQLTT